MFQLNVTQTLKLFLIGIGNKSERVEESKRWLCSKSIPVKSRQKKTGVMLVQKGKRLNCTRQCYRIGTYSKAFKEVEEAPCLVGAKAAADAKREAKVRANNFMMTTTRVSFAKSGMQGGVRLCLWYSV
jgi:hypothetical protein